MKAKRVDGNQKELVRRIRLIPHISVQHLHTVGQGFPDILVGYEGYNYLFEIKDPMQPPSKRRLTEAEAAWHLEWNGTVHIVETIDDVLTILKLI